MSKQALRVCIPGNGAIITLEDDTLVADGLYNALTHAAHYVKERECLPGDFVWVFAASAWTMYIVV